MKNIYIIIVLTVICNVALSADKLEPKSASFQGVLQPAYGVDGFIIDNTVIFTQPWHGRNRWENREVVVYFKNNGKADSKLWTNVPWNVKGNSLCFNGAQVNSCYAAYSDSTGQAFLKHKGSKLLASVEGIEVGDSRGVGAAYRKLQSKKKAALEQRQAQARASMALIGLFAAAMVGGGSGSDAGKDCYLETCSGASRPGSAMPIK